MTISIPARSLAISRSEDADLFQSYWDAAVDGLFTMRVLPTGQFIHEGINRALAEGTGLQEAQLRGRTPDEALAASTAGIANERFEACMAAGKPIDFLEVLDLPNGISIWRGSLVPIRGEGGRIERLLGRMHDDTEQWRSTALLQSLSGLLQDTFASIRCPLAILDTSGAIRMTNAAWREWRALRGPADGLVTGGNFLDFCDQAAGRVTGDAAVVRDGVDGLLRGAAYSFSHTYEMGAGLFTLRAARFDHEREAWVVITREDVTAERRARETSEQLLTVQDEERHRIALELHDSTSQHLVAIQFGLAALRRKPDSTDVMDDMRSELTEAQREIRSISYLLHPPKLAKMGLVATLRRYVDGLRRRSSASVVLDVEGLIDTLPLDVQQAVFRVIQEAVSNAYRHAAARRISVELTLRRRGLRLIVASNGRRMAPEAEVPAGVGIAGMRARLEAFGGALSVEATRFGTRVLGVVPGPRLLELERLALLT